MAALDARLERHVRGVRVMLAVDAVLGVVMALLVLAQATLLARTAARAFGGASLDELATSLVVLAAVVAARAGAAYGFETVGRRAAVDAVSTLRLGLVDRRLRDRPYALDSAESAELASVAVNGVDALEITFSRYLPQAVLAVVVPVAVLCPVGWIDPISAGLMLLTLPLIPVFMWLVGRDTEQRTRARWQALTLLATHFLDVVRGLPTLRAFNRSGRQSATIAEVSEQYRGDEHRRAHPPPHRALLPGLDLLRVPSPTRRGSGCSDESRGGGPAPGVGSTGCFIGSGGPSLQRRPSDSR